MNQVPDGRGHRLTREALRSLWVAATGLALVVAARGFAPYILWPAMPADLAVSWVGAGGSGLLVGIALYPGSTTAPDPLQKLFVVGLAFVSTIVFLGGMIYVALGALPGVHFAYLDAISIVALGGLAAMLAVLAILSEMTHPRALYRRPMSFYLLGGLVASYGLLGFVPPVTRYVMATNPLAFIVLPGIGGSFVLGMLAFSVIGA